MSISKEDYEEPRCLLCMDNADIVPIPIGRVLEKLDGHLARCDFEAAERHLKYWLTEAEHGGDRRGMLTVLNEQIGLYRKTEREAQGTAAIEAALALADTLGMENTVTYGTTLVNAATAYKSFGKTDRALELYERAKTLYETLLDSDDERLGGLYNNMALTLTALGMYERAEAMFFDAVDIMSKKENGELEVAITYLNLADLAASKLGLEDGETLIGDYLDRAEKLLDTETLDRDGYYAFVCEKCASTFGYYGYFLTEQKLARRAREIYERA